MLVKFCLDLGALKCCRCSVIADDGVICTIYTEYIADVASAVAETRSSPLPQPINYGHTGDKKGKIFVLTLHTLVCYQTKCMNVCSLLLSFEYKEGKENFGCMSERILRFVHLLLFFSLFHCLSIKYWTFSMKKLFFYSSTQCLKIMQNVSFLHV